LLGFPHWMGVVLVGATVIVIVVSAGMVSTTYVQFLKGLLLVLFSAILVWILLVRGFHARSGGSDGYEFRTLGPAPSVEALGLDLVPADAAWDQKPFVRSRDPRGDVTVWHVQRNDSGEVVLRESQTMSKSPAGWLVNGRPKGKGPGESQLHPVGYISRLPGDVPSSGPLDPLSFLATLQQSEVILWGSEKILEVGGGTTTVYFPKPTCGSRVLRPGEHPTFQGIRSDKLFDKVNFVSLMLALFCGTASLPHILIRYYTVKDERSARRSTIVGIASIGCFYVLTLYLGLGAMTSGALDVSNENMAAPLLAKSISELLFAIVSAIAFTTVLGTVSGLILASSGAVTHDLLVNVAGWNLTDHERVRVAKTASVVVGAVAILLGILFEKMNPSYLVGWAFSVAASANLPSLVLVLFWNGVTRQGVISAVSVGMVTSLAWILLSAETYSKVYGLPVDRAWTPFSQPGIVTIPLGFLTLVVVSWVTRDRPAVAR